MSCRLKYNTAMFEKVDDQLLKTGQNFFSGPVETKIACVMLK